VLAEEGAWSRLKGSPMRIDWKSKERKWETFQKLTWYIIEKKHIYIHASPLAKVLGLHATKGFYIKSRNWELQRSWIYATSAFCSVAEEMRNISEARYNAEPAHNTTKYFAPNLRWDCQSHRFAWN
jgi:hypothetical protein